MVREQTVKAVLSIINKLNDRIINGELLKFLARTANDEQPGIRTNTTICLGRIAKNLGQSVSYMKPQRGLKTDVVADKIQGAHCCVHEIHQGSIFACARCWSTRLVCYNRLLYRGRLCWEDSASSLSGTSRQGKVS